MDVQENEARIAGVVTMVVIGLWVGSMGVTRVTNYLDATDDLETTQARLQEVDYNRRGQSSRYGGPTWVLDLRYTYTVDGTTYEGTALSADGSNEVGGEDAARKFVRTHPENSTVEVYYVPSNPDRAFLRKTPLTTVVTQNLASLLVSVLCLGIAAKLALDARE